MTTKFTCFFLHPETKQNYRQRSFIFFFLFPGSRSSCANSLCSSESTENGYYSQQAKRNKVLKEIKFSGGISESKLHQDIADIRQMQPAMSIATLPWYNENGPYETWRQTGDWLVKAFYSIILQTSQPFAQS